MKETLAYLKSATKDFFDIAHRTATTIINTIVLSFVYIVGIGLTSILGKMAKRTFLNKSLDNNVQTYWEPLKSREARTDALKQF